LSSRRAEYILHCGHVGTVAPYTYSKGRDQGHISQISHRRYAHHMAADDTPRYLPTAWVRATPLRPALCPHIYLSVAVGRHARCAPISFKVHWPCPKSRMALNRKRCNIRKAKSLHPIAFSPYLVRNFLEQMDFLGKAKVHSTNTTLA